MALPVTSNMTCDIWRSGNLGNATPDVANVPCFLKASYYDREEHGEKDPVITRWTHTMMMDISTDVRDGYSYGNYGNNPDSVTIPAGATGANRTIFNVTFVEAKAPGSPQTYKKVYLDRLVPTWPTKYT